MQMAVDSKPISHEIRAKMEQYRVDLLTSGMLEPSKAESAIWHWLFYKPTTELTAFVVNLTGTDDSIEVTYGYASTAFTRLVGCENCLIESGVRDEEITIRGKIVICDEADEATARNQIAQMHERYLQTPKDELLIEAKAKRKAFIQQIAVKLKPMGFKKKANTWTRTLEGDYYLTFDAQKSSFSDEYYFNVRIGNSKTGNYGGCYYTRLFPSGMCPMDWQALSKDEFEFFLNRTVVPALEKIIRTPLYELGKLPSIWSCCSCDRKKCKSNPSSNQDTASTLKADHNHSKKRGVIMTFLETSRLRLRNVTAKDADIMYDYRNNEICARYQRGQTKDYAGITGLVDSRKNDVITTESPFFVAVALKDSDEMVGEIVVMPNEGTISLGYTFSYRYHRKGYAYEALSALISLLHECYPDWDFISFTEPENEPSMALLKKLGYKDMGYALSIESQVFGKWTTPATEAEIAQATKE